MTDTESRRSWWQRPEAALFVLVLLVAGTWVHPLMAQQASRYAFTAAVYDDGTIVLDDYQHVLGIDRAVRDGHTYSDKAPGEPILAIPFYAAYRAVGGEPATILRIDGNLGLWWITFWMASVPLALLAVLLYRYARQIDETWGTIAAVGISLGTILLPLGGLLFGHTLVACVVFASFYLVDRGGGSLRSLVGGGALAGFAVLVEYTAVIAVLAIVAFAALRWKAKVLLLMAAGLPFAMLLGIYNEVAFGDPFVLSYSYSAFNDVTETARPVLDVFGRLDLSNVLDVFFSPRGFLLASPVVLLGLAGSWSLWRSNHSAVGVIGLATFLAYLAIPAYWSNPWGGDSPGPRYMTPALPFLVAGVAYAGSKLRRLGGYIVGISVLMMFFALATDPLLPRSGAVGVNTWIDWVAEGEFAPNLLTMVFGGTPGMALLLALAAAVGWWLVRTERGASALKASVTSADGPIGG